MTIERIVDALSSIAFNESARDADRISALEKLGRHLGMFKDVLEHKLNVTNFSFKLDRPGRDE